MEKKEEKRIDPKSILLAKDVLDWFEFRFDSTKMENLLHGAKFWSQEDGSLIIFADYEGMSVRVSIPAGKWREESEEKNFIASKEAFANLASEDFRRSLGLGGTECSNQEKKKRS